MEVPATNVVDECKYLGDLEATEMRLHASWAAAVRGGLLDRCGTGAPTTGAPCVRDG